VDEVRWSETERECSRRLRATLPGHARRVNGKGRVVAEILNPSNNPAHKSQNHKDKGDDCLSAGIAIV
jgi:hypothetical protein